VGYVNDFWKCKEAKERRKNVKKWKEEGKRKETEK